MSDSAKKLAQTMCNIKKDMSSNQKKEFDKLVTSFMREFHSSAQFRAQCGYWAAIGVSALGVWLDDHKFRW